MKVRIGIFLLFLTYLVALPTDVVRACGSAGICQEVAPSDDDNEISTNIGSCLDDSPCKNCPPDTDGCGHCHCAGCGIANAPHSLFYKNTFVEVFPVPDWLYADRAVNFCYDAPSTSAHRTILFQPPRV